MRTTEHSKNKRTSSTTNRNKILNLFNTNNLDNNNVPLCLPCNETYEDKTVTAPTSVPQNPNTEHTLAFTSLLLISAYMNAYVSNTKITSIQFDSDMVKLVLDTGASVTLTPNRNDFCTYHRTEGKVKGLGTMKIVGTGTVKYTVRNINGQPVTLVIDNVYHVPGLPIRLLSPQQLIRQYKRKYDLPAECVIRPDGAKILLKNNLFSINYDDKSNLPIWKTVPGATRAENILNKHFEKCYLSSSSD